MSPLIDKDSVSVVSAQCAQVLHRTVLPEKRGRLRWEEPWTVDIEGIGHRVQSEAHHLAAAVGSADEAFISALHGSEINDLAAFPKDNTKFPPAWEQWINFTVLGISRDQSVRSDPEGLAAGASRERAQIGQHALLSLECVRNETVGVKGKRRERIGRGRVGPAHRFPLAVEYSIKPICEVTHRPPERAEFNKLVMMVVVPVILVALRGQLDGERQQSEQSYSRDAMHFDEFHKSSPLAFSCKFA